MAHLPGPTVGNIKITLLAKVGDNEPVEIGTMDCPVRLTLGTEQPPLQQPPTYRYAPNIQPCTTRDAHDMIRALARQFDPAPFYGERYTDPGYKPAGHPYAGTDEDHGK